MLGSLPSPVRAATFEEMLQRCEAKLRFTARVLCSTDLRCLRNFPPHEVTSFIKKPQNRRYLENIYAKAADASMHDWNVAHPDEKLICKSEQSITINLQPVEDPRSGKGDPENQRTSTAHPSVAAVTPPATQPAFTHGHASEIQQPEASPPCAARETPVLA